MDSSVRISVIVPCYNIEQYVRRCVQSILKQDQEPGAGFRLEILLVDDGSTDRTGSICKRLAVEDDRIRVFRQENAGPGIARNTGIEQATGELLAFADGDDAMLPGMLKTLTDALRETGADIAVCPYLTVSAEAALRGEIPDRDAPDTVRRSVKRHQSGEDVSGEGTADAAVDEPRIRVLTRDEALIALVSERDDLVIQNAAWNKLYRREVFDGIRYPAKRYEDIPTAARLIAAARTVCYVDRPLYAYTQNRGTSIMNGSERQSILTEQIPAYRERDRFFTEIGREDLKWMHDYMVGKKLLILYTQGRWQAKDRKFSRSLRQEIDQWFGPDFEQIYGCPIADRHHRLRMRLFLIHPLLYDLFTALNEGVALPIRRRIWGRHRTG